MSAPASRQPFVVWLTGLSGAGKSTIASIVERRLHDEGVLVCNLDGDLLRTGLNRDLGFSDADRVENIRRVGEVARLMASAGVTVIVSAISPFRAGRQTARELMGPGQFVEVHVDTAALLERSYARQAGLGWIGKNTCLINQEIGSWVFLGEILTSLEIEPDSPPPDRCGTCTRCIDACPTQAIAPEGYEIDARRCGRGLRSARRR